MEARFGKCAIATVLLAAALIQTSEAQQFGPRGSAWQGQQPVPPQAIPQQTQVQGTPRQTQVQGTPQNNPYQPPYSGNINGVEVIHGQQEVLNPPPAGPQRATISDQPPGSPPAGNPQAGKPAGDSNPAPEDGEKPKETDALTASIAKAIKEVEAAENLDAAKKTEWLDFLNKATKWLETNSQNKQKALEYEGEVTTAPKLLEELKGKLAEQSPPAVPEVPADSTLSQLEQGLNTAQEKLKTAREKLTKREQEANAKHRADRKAELAKLKETNAKRLEDAEKELKTFEAADAADRGVVARKLELEARVASLNSQQKMFEAERKRLDALADVFPMRRDLAQREVTNSEKLVAAWQDIVTRFRKLESERQAEEARMIASEAHPAVRDVALRNAALAEQRNKLTEEMEQVTAYLEAVDGQLKSLDSDYTDVKNKVEVYGMTPTVGLLLRNRRKHLPPLEDHRTRLGFCQTNMQDAQVALLDLETERSGVGDIDESVTQTMKDLTSINAQFQPGYLETMVRELFQGRRELLDSLLSDYHKYHDDLANLELRTRELISETEEYRQFIDENVLWIPSAPRLAVSDAGDSMQAVMSFANVRRSSRLMNDIAGNVRQHPLATLGILALIAAAFFSAPALIRRLTKQGRIVAGANSLIVCPTMWAFANTMLLAGRWPMVFAAIGGWMMLIDRPGQWANGCMLGMFTMAAVQFVLESFRQTCRPEGLAEHHFDWPKESLPTVYRSLRWFTVLALPLVMAESMITYHEGGQWQDSLGRVILLASLGLVTVGMHFLFTPRSGPIPTALSEAGATWLHRLRHVWYLGAVGFPVALCVLLGMGYIYSAHELLSRLWMAGCLLLAFVLAQELSSRAMAVAWKRMRLRQMRERRIKPRQRGTTESHEPPPEPEPVLEHGDQHLRQFVQYAAVMSFVICNWFIWSDVLPALQVFDRVELWTTTAMVSQEVAQADGTMVTERVPKDVPITLSNVAFSVFALIATFLAAKTLPSLLEISVLGRLPIDRGGRHAIVIISRYAVSVLGFLLACNLIGVRWSSVQWLAAAMTVGLGFGLQEIFANLVSGLIILFERPIRIGDLVTVGGTTGRITRMQIRATTITDFDRRELIVPNKKFITDDVVNWTLSDPITRFVLPVGISYSCDPDQAQKILMKVAEGHPLVMREPEPTAVFVGFGNSTLDLELRVFLAKRDDFAILQHGLNIAVERAFKEAGIEIAFPQQDIHIKSVTSIPQVQEIGNSKAA